MPYRTPEARRLAYDTNREMLNAKMREYRAKNRDRLNAQVRARRAANPEHYRAVSRAWREANAAKVTQQNRLRGIRRDRAKLSANGLKRKHGITPESRAKMWAAQDGRCYLCHDLLVDEPRKAVVEHDHACCGPSKSCAACQRGLACARCNKIVGFAQDDPDRLRRIADSLEQTQARRRQAVQVPLTLDFA